MRRTPFFFKFKISSTGIYTGFCMVTVSENLPKIPLFGPSFIHQLWLLGSQQHQQSGVVLTSLSTWGTENSLAKINLESTGVKKGCNIFLGSKIGKHLELRVWAHYHATRKNLESRTQLDEPGECTSGDDPLLLYKICIYCFSLWYKFFVHYSLRVEKNYQHGLDAGPLEFQFLRLRECLTNPFRTLLLCFGVIGKKPGLNSRNNFVKKIFVCIGHHDNVVARCDSIFPLLWCQGVWNKTCT